MYHPMSKKGRMACGSCHQCRSMRYTLHSTVFERRTPIDNTSSLGHPALQAVHISTRGVTIHQQLNHSYSTSQIYVYAWMSEKGLLTRASCRRSSLL